MSETRLKVPDIGKKKIKKIRVPLQEPTNEEINKYGTSLNIKLTMPAIRIESNDTSPHPIHITKFK